MKEDRIVTLDGIRGIAVLMVVAFHYINNQMFSNSWMIDRFGTPAALLKILTYFGWSGVDLFFILSGFLIGNILLKNKHSRFFFRTFYIRRFFRIIPIYYLLIVIFLLLRASSLYNAEAYIFARPIPGGAYFGLIQNFYMAHYNHFGPQALTPTWSLCVEEQFYLLIPFLVFFTNTRYAWIMGIAGIVIAIVARSMAGNFYQGYVLLPSRIDSPMLGFLIAWLHQSAAFRTWAAQRIAWLWTGLLLLVVGCAQLYVKTDPGIFGHTLLGILYGLIVVIALYSKRNLFTRVLSSAFLLEIGKLSYFIYLYHQLINGVLHLAVLKQLKPELDSYHSIGITAASLLITYLLAKISFRYLEKPLIGFSHQFKFT